MKSFQELRIVFANPEADVKQKLEIISSYLPVMEQTIPSAHKP